ncbi:MAG: SUMF1/EgtB/PvdO family nonheme iron enzyme [Chloroflexi bacterium]|nr:SUMF1/EgtB/PvdO family nonheme iron enzyme [Chloroflexota bacterium]
MSGTPLPESFGRNGAYKVVGIIGRGGFATVYKAYHAALDRHVAIKVLRPEMVEPEGARNRFQIEARASARLAGHPNIVTVYDYGEEDGSAYLVLQFVDGLTLDKRLAKPITAREIDKIVSGVASALDFAHRNSLIHRDIKPSNVLLEQDGTAILSDFGIAKLLDATASMTNTLLGTPDYMSPEQITGSPLDARSDVYALGVMVYRIFAGKTPFQGAPMAILHQHVHAPVPELPPNPLTGRPAPAAVEAVIRRALAKHPEDRQHTAGQLAAELRQALRPLILAEQAQDALRASDMSRAEGLAAELVRDHPSYPEGSQIQQEIARQRARLAQRSRVQGLIDAEQWQTAAEEIDRFGLRGDRDTGVQGLIRQADAGLAAERARQEAARRTEQERQRREAEAREAQRREQEAQRREQEARQAAWREQQAREAAQREAEAREAARREQEAREQARREFEAREQARRDAEAREQARREAEAQEQARRDAEAREQARREFEARELARRQQEAREAEERRQQQEQAERARREQQAQAERERREREQQDARERAERERARLAHLEELERQVDRESGLSSEEIEARAGERTRQRQAKLGPAAAAAAAPGSAGAGGRSPVLPVLVGLVAVALLVAGGIFFVPGVLPALMGRSATATPSASQPTATPAAAKPTAGPTTAPAAKPTEPAAKPTDPAAKPTQPAAKPTEPAAKPTEPAAKPTTPPTVAEQKPVAPTTAPAKPEPPTPVPPTPTVALPGRITAQDGAEMALIAAGGFQMGQDGDASTGPRFTLALPAFYIDVTEVTNARFQQYVQETGSKPEGDWRRFFDAANFDAKFYDVERNDHPVVNVTWKDADSYCRWAGKRLPFEAEWEKAARGVDGRLWPWGNEPHPEFANIENQTEGEPDTRRVGSFPRGASPYGILDMTGNAREWTDSSLQPYPLTQPTGSAAGAGSRVTRGGSWLSLPNSIELTRRLAEPVTIAAKDLGFRCAVSADQARGR